MSKYIELVTCKQGGGNYLFYAPAFTRFIGGQSVIVDTRYGEMPATVISSLTVSEGSETYDFIVKATGAKLPLKRVLSVITTKELEYEEETHGTDKD